MLGLTKSTDYALMALAHLASSTDGRSVRAREIAHSYDIPHELLAKILQRLAKAGLLESTPGPTGGYTLAFAPEFVSIGQVIEAVEGAPALMQCLSDRHPECEQHTKCTIRRPLERVNARVFQLLQRISIAEMTSGEQSDGTAGFVRLSDICAGHHAPASGPRVAS